MKKNIMGAISALAFAAGVLCPTAGWSDLVWNQVTTTTLEINGQVQEMGKINQRYHLKSNLARVDELDEGGITFYNFQSREVVMVSLTGNVFFKTPLLEIINQNQAAREEVRANLPEREKAIAAEVGPQAEAMKAQLEAQKRKFDLHNRPYSLAPTGERAEINGRNCVKSVGRAGEEAFQEVWVAEDLPLDSMVQSYFVRGMVALDPHLNGYFGFVAALPIRVVCHYGAVTVTIDVLEVETVPILVDAFILQDGLKEAETETPGR